MSLAGENAAWIVFEKCPVFLAVAVILDGHQISAGVIGAPRTMPDGSTAENTPNRFNLPADEGQRIWRDGTRRGERINCVAVILFVLDIKRPLAPTPKAKRRERHEP